MALVYFIYQGLKVAVLFSDRKGQSTHACCIDTEFSVLMTDDDDGWMDGSCENEELIMKRREIKISARLHLVLQSIGLHNMQKGDRCSRYI